MNAPGRDAADVPERTAAHRTRGRTFAFWRDDYGIGVPNSESVEIRQLRRWLQAGRGVRRCL